MAMDHSAWYGGQTHPYHLQEPPAVPVNPHLYNAAAPEPASAYYQQLPSETLNPFPPSSSTPAAASAAATSAQHPYHSYNHPPNPNSIPGRPDAPAPVSSHLYEPPPPAGGGAPQPQPPEVDAFARNPYGPYAGYTEHAAHYVYPTEGAAPYYPGPAGGDARAFSAKDAIRQYGMDPVAYGNASLLPHMIPSQHPVFSIHRKKATRPYYGTKRKKDKKIAKVVQSAYCEVCKVDCNTQEVLACHRQGKKHKKNLEKVKESIAPKPSKVPTATVENKEITEAEKDKTEAEKHKTAGEQTKRSLASVPEVDLETKKRRLLEEGAKADGMRVCTICNIVCNSEVVFNYHVAGQKHTAMVKKQVASTN